MLIFRILVLKFQPWFYSNWVYMFPGIYWSKVCPLTICLSLFWYSSTSRFRLCIRCVEVTVYTLVLCSDFLIACFDIQVHFSGNVESGAFLWHCWCSVLPIVPDTSWNCHTSGSSWLCCIFEYIICILDKEKNWGWLPMPLYNSLY